MNALWSPPPFSPLFCRSRNGPLSAGVRRSTEKLQSERSASVNFNAKLGGPVQPLDPKARRVEGEGMVGERV